MPRAQVVASGTDLIPVATTAPLARPLESARRIPATLIEAAPVMPLREPLTYEVYRPGDPLVARPVVLRDPKRARELVSEQNRKALGLGALALTAVAVFAVVISAFNRADDNATSRADTTSAELSAPQPPLPISPMPASTDAFTPVPRLPPVPHRRAPRRVPPNPLQSSR